MIFKRGSSMRYLLAVLYAAAGLWISSPAAAQGASDDPKTVARAHYEKGKGLYDSGDYAGALKSFQEAYDVQPHPVVLKSIAECKVLLGDIPGAIENLETFLKDADAKGKIAVENRVAELKKMLVSVEVNSSPAGATIAVDGSDSEKTTPATIYLGPGDHEVTLTTEGYEPLSKQLSLAAGTTAEILVDFPTEGVSTAAAEPEPEEALAEEEEEEDYEEEDEGKGVPAGFWVAAAFTGVGLVSGTVFGSLALGTEKDYADEPTQAKKDAGERQALIADISFGVAAAAAVTGTVILLVHASKKESDDSAARFSITPVASQKAFGLSAKVEF